MGVEAAVGAGARLAVSLLALKGPVLVAKAEHHQKQDRDMCLEVLPDPRLAPKVAAVVIQNLGWKLMTIHDHVASLIIINILSFLPYKTLLFPTTQLVC
jgi:hypothetical protein